MRFHKAIFASMALTAATAANAVGTAISYSVTIHNHSKHTFFDSDYDNVLVGPEKIVTYTSAELYKRKWISITDYEGITPVIFYFNLSIPK